MDRVPFNWPDPPLRLVLVEPEIPQNTGNIARLCAATGSTLHLVGQLGFHLTSSRLRRAGLDYWESVTMRRHPTWEAFLEDGARGQRSGDPIPAEEENRGRIWFFSTRGRTAYTAVQYQPGDALVFGSETRGLPVGLLDRHPGQVLTLPMQVEHVRSLNLANTVAIVLYEALRQINTSPS